MMIVVIRASKKERQKARKEGNKQYKRHEIESESERKRYRDI